MARTCRDCLNARGWRCGEFERTRPDSEDAARCIGFELDPWADMTDAQRSAELALFDDGHDRDRDRSWVAS